MRQRAEKEKRELSTRAYHTRVEHLRKLQGSQLAIADDTDSVVVKFLSRTMNLF